MNEEFEDLRNENPRPKTLLFSNWLTPICVTFKSHYILLTDYEDKPFSFLIRVGFKKVNRVVLTSRAVV